jgi:PAS domain S-box
MGLVVSFSICDIIPSGEGLKAVVELPVYELIIVAVVLLLFVLLLFFYRRKFSLQKQRTEFQSSELQLFRMLIDNMPDFIYIKDTKSRFIVANKYTAAMLHCSDPEKLLGKTDFDFFPKELAQKFYMDEQRIIKSKVPLINIEEDALDQNNEKITISTTKVPWLDKDGNALGIIGIGRNITKLKEFEQRLIEQTANLQEVNVLLEERNEQVNHQAEELTAQAENLKKLNVELQKTNETKDKFISIIAHDLKNPFNAIINFSELLILKSSDTLQPKQLDMIKIINSSSKTAYSLLENLLYWGKNQNSSIAFHPTKLNISDIIKEVIDFHNVSAVIKNITITDKSKPDVMVYADLDMVTTILRNLLNNAIKFTSKDGQIEIACDIENKFAVVKVTDNGIGIPPELMETLFIPVKESTKGTSGESGTGLGLVLCKEFATRNGGDIIVKSEVDQGSSFILSLPLASDF